jgi:hypothetical protein
LAKLLAIAVTLLAALFFAASPKAIKQKNESSFLYSNPLVSKGALGIFSPFAADFAWLESIKIGEVGRGGSYKVDNTEFKTAFMTIASLDPHFYHAINYGSGFLYTIQKDKQSAFEIIDRALLQNKEDFRLLYVKLVIEVTSENPDKKLLKELAKEVYTHPDFKGVFGVMKVDDFLIEILNFAEDKASKNQQLREDLEWLYKNTKDKNKKELIAQKLKELS